MNTNSSNSKRIAKNTVLLYFRQILIILVNLYTVRIVLNVLGVEDYGVYNLVAGVVSMFLFMRNTMANASQRYFSYDLGKKDVAGLRKTFSITFQIYFLFIIIVLLIAETFGLWFVNHKLVINESRMIAANYVYQFAILSFVLSLISSPYMALIISYENMDVYAYISIVEVSLKLAIVFVLKILPFDKLILYGFLIFAVDLINVCIYLIYCLNHYKACRIQFIFDKLLFKEIVGYSGWNLIGSIANVLKIQGNNIILNLSFGPVVNAARSVSTQVNSAINGFALNFSTAMRPQLIKSYAAGEKEEVHKLVNQGSKITFFLMLLFTLPLVVEIDYILDIWLKNPPENAKIFTCLFLIEGLFTSLTYQLMTLAQATGKMKLYQIVVGGLLLLNLPLSYFELKIGCPAYCVNLTSLIIAFIAVFARLFVIKKITDFSIMNYIKKTIVPCIIIMVLASILPVFIHFKMNYGFLRLFVVCVVSTIVITLCFMFIGFNKQERSNIKKIIMKKLGR